MMKKTSFQQCKSHVSFTENAKAGYLQLVFKHLKVVFKSSNND